MSSPDETCGPVLILGAEGMLGHALMDRFRTRFGREADKHVVGWDIEDIDIRHAGAFLEALRNLRPSIVVNAAAYSDVDGCETHVELAMAVNGEGPGHVARACREIGAALVHFGTDFIFDGMSRRPYRPDDTPCPLSVYGRSKWEGEEAVRATRCRHLIVRTSWLFGPSGRNFVEAILARASEGQTLRVVTDQVGSPTSAADLADAVDRLLDVEAEGIVHFTNAGHCSRFDYAKEIVRQMGLDKPVQPINSEQLGRPARRPPYSVLDVSRYTELTHHKPDTWQDSLKRYLSSLSG